MRGFGAVQTCFAHEAQMDKLADALDMDPVELRRRNAMSTGTRLPTGQRVDCPAPVAELLERVVAMPPPEDGDGVPGGIANVTRGEGVVRGVGYAVGYKNVSYSEGFDDYSTARVRILLVGGEPLVEVHTAAAEVGQGLVTVQEQIARTELGVERVVVLPADTNVGTAGSSSASRQTMMTGGAVKIACEAVREELERRGGKLDEPIEATREYHHRQTFPLDENGQGDAHVTFAFAAHRAVVDVDTELGLVRVVEIATAQDVGKAINPQAVEGQIEGGIAQGLGLALMEEIQVVDGEVRNASFTDYLIPTVLDMPPVKLDVLELGDPEAPYGLRGVGEPPTISSTPAIVSALRNATGAALTRVPVRPDDIVGL
jgi:CO/xanthine dehydrogenase Mo-binding subunit